MVEPVVVPRAEHSLSRRDIDSDALRVLYRLKHAGFIAYLVGGSVRDLLLGRRPKDFDIGTSAHPYQVKRLFRHCFIIGRRFRLAHVKFGQKVIEVATFRRQVPESAGPEPDPATTPVVHAIAPATGALDLLVRRDNTFGTPEEDAFRRDFTINALFYDIASFSIIDYVGGLRDLNARLVRSIGDPDRRFQEDPVRMLRAVALASRLDFSIDPPTRAAIDRHRAEIARSSPARLLEEYYKILRAGASECTFRALADAGLLAPVTPELPGKAPEALWTSLAALDHYRRRFATVPPALTTPILVGSLIVPLGFAPDPYARREEDGGGSHSWLGALPVARKDLERLRHVLLLQRRLRDPSLSPRATRSLMARSAFADALTWLEIHGEDPAAVARWQAVLAESPGGTAQEAAARFRPRRRRRRRRRPRQPQT